MGSRRTTAAMCLALLLTALRAGATTLTVAVLPASGSNVHEGYLQAAGDVLRGHLLASGAFEVRMVPGEVSRSEVDAAQAVAAGHAAETDLALVLHVARLRTTAQVRVTVYRVDTGEVAHADQLKAGSPDDLDAVLARLVAGLVTGEKARGSADIYTVTEAESDPLLRLGVTGVWGLKLGYMVASAGDTQTMPGLSVFWLYDARTFLAEIDVGFHNGDSGAADSFVGLGLYYPHRPADTTPFVGGGLRYGGGNYDGHPGSGSGIQLFGTAGMLFGRTSSVQVRGDVSVFYNTFAGKAERRWYDDTGVDEDAARGILLKVGIGL